MKNRQLQVWSCPTRRILELKGDLDEAQMLIGEMQEQVQDSNDMIDRWVEAFEITLGDNGTYSPAPWIAKMESYLDKYNALAAQWNKFIPKYNAAVAPRRIGRPVAVLFGPSVAKADWRAFEAYHERCWPKRRRYQFGPYTCKGQKAVNVLQHDGK